MVLVDPPGWGVVAVVCDGVVVVALVVGVDVVVVVEVAALAMAAPPPASAPVTASVVMRAFIRRIFTSFLDWASTIAPRRLSAVGAS